MIISETLFLPDLGVFQCQREHSWPSGYGGFMSAESHSLVCPRCQKIWAILRLDEEADIWPRPAFCAECGGRDDWRPVPGSILSEEGWGSIDTSLLDALPETLLRREFDLHMKEFMRAADAARR